jgi:hypothetical protein
LRTLKGALVLSHSVRWRRARLLAPFIIDSRF